MTFQPSWDKTGIKITGKYLGEFPYEGIVESTRVCYGTDLEYRVRLLDMIEVYGGWKSTLLIRKDADSENYILVDPV